MTKNYKHKTTGQACSASQYIAELCCLRQAEKENVGRPAYALWNTEKWQKEFKKQIISASKLLKKYDEKAILNALNSSRGRRIFSVSPKWVHEIIEEEQKKLDKINSREIKEVQYEDHTLSKPKKPFGKKSILSKFKDLDNE